MMSQYRAFGLVLSTEVESKSGRAICALLNNFSAVDLCRFEHDFYHS
jgi:hypothetical protein